MGKPGIASQAAMQLTGVNIEMTGARRRGRSQLAVQRLSEVLVESTMPPPCVHLLMPQGPRDGRPRAAWSRQSQDRYPFKLGGSARGRAVDLFAPSVTPNSERPVVVCDPPTACDSQARVPAGSNGTATSAVQSSQEQPSA